jgi:hypothetical protein
MDAPPALRRHFMVCSAIVVVSCATFAATATAYCMEPSPVSNGALLLFLATWVYLLASALILTIRRSPHASTAWLCFMSALPCLLSASLFYPAKN